MIAANSTPNGFAPWCLAELCEVITDGTHKTPKYTETGIPFISTANIEPFHSFKFDSYKKFISETEHAELTRRCKPEFGDILVSKIGTLGLTKFVDVDYEFSIFVGVALLKLRKAVIDGRFLEQLLNTETYKQAMAAASPGSTRSTLTLTAIKNLQVSIPSLETQRRIAEVLSTVDQAIEQTEALIAKQQRIKTGLMQDLLTRGIDEHGNLRSEQTHEFKDSPLGRIPVEWEVKRLDDLLVEKRYGISTSLSEEPIGTPVLRMNNLMNGEIDYSNLKYSTREDARKLTLNEGDVLFNRTNSIDYVGRTGIYRNLDQRISFASYLVRLVTDSTRLHPEYLNLLLNDRANQIRVKQFATIGVQQANVNPTNLGTLNIALPNDVTEQDKIIEAISTSRNCIHDIDANFRKLCSLKTGLMQDLLTGKKRVTALLHDTEAVHG